MRTAVLVTTRVLVGCGHGRSDGEPPQPTTTLSRDQDGTEHSETWSWSLANDPKGQL